MNKPLLKKIRALMILMFFISSVSFSQMDNVDFLKAGASDGVKLIEAYITPWANAFGAGLNGSWYNTAKPHKWTGFDVTFGVNAGFVPTSATTFDVSTIGLSSNVTGTGIAPTIAGPEEDGPELSVETGGVTLATFNTPPGSGWKIIPVPTLQVGMGLPLGTELKGRFIPKIPIREGDISLWGIGIMHSIIQYIPGNELFPFDVSAFAGYTKLSASVPLELEPGEPQNYTSYDPFTDFIDQELTTGVGALNAGIVGSFNLPVITFYAGLGYSKTKTEIKLKGFYPTPTLVSGPVPYAEYNDSGVIEGDDFPFVSIENFSGLRANAGIRLKLALVTIHIDYTRSNYNVLSAGLGISFR
jgi:hypothetical protein